MSVIINGQAANITTPLTAVISSAVAGGGITTCTTTAPHLFGNQDSIVVTGATGMTGLNAAWTITVTGSSTFTIPSALSGTYGASSATATDYSLTPQFQWPSDGDAASAQLSGLISGATMLASYAQYLQNQVVTLQSVQPGLQCYVHSLLPSLTVASPTASWPVNAFNTTISSGSPLVFSQVIPALAGDVLEVECGVTINTEYVSGSGSCEGFYLRLEYAAAGATNTTPLPGAYAFLYVGDVTASTNINLWLSASLVGALTIATTANYYLYMNGYYVNNAGSIVMNYRPALTGTNARLWRTSGLL